MDLIMDRDIVHDHNYHIINQEHNIIHDHNYAIQNEANKNAGAVRKVELDEHNNHDFKNEVYKNDGAIGVEHGEHNYVAVISAQTYTKVVGVQRSTEKIKDNLGFLYHKNKETESQIYLVCVEKKMQNKCRATAAISTDRNDNSFMLWNQHNHLVRPFNNEAALLKHEISKK